MGADGEPLQGFELIFDEVYGPAVEENKVEDNEQQDLASALGKFRDDVVEAPKAKK